MTTPKNTKGSVRINDVELGIIQLNIIELTNECIFGIFLN